MRIPGGAMLPFLVAILTLAGCSTTSAHDLAAEACASVDLDGKSEPGDDSDPSAAEMQQLVNEVGEAADKAGEAAAIDSGYRELVLALTRVEAETMELQRMLENNGSDFDSYSREQLRAANAWVDSYESARVRALSECRIVEAG